MEMVELLVRMDCQGCERTIRKALAKLKGVESVDVDLAQKKVTVTGFVDRKKVLRAVRNTGKGVEFWNHSLETDYPLYTTTSHAFSKTYNYYKHGSNLPLEYVHSTYYDEDEVEFRHASSIFSDDNTKGCSIM